MYEEDDKRLGSVLALDLDPVVVGVGVVASPGEGTSRDESVADGSHVVARLDELPLRARKSDEPVPKSLSPTLSPRLRPLTDEELAPPPNRAPNSLAPPAVSCGGGCTAEFDDELRDMLDDPPNRPETALKTPPLPSMLVKLPAVAGLLPAPDDTDVANILSGLGGRWPGEKGGMPTAALALSVACDADPDLLRACLCCQAFATPSPLPPCKIDVLKRWMPSE